MNVRFLERYVAGLMLLVFAMQMTVVNIQGAFAATLNDVVINEIGWAGSSAGSADEWIELYNNTDAVVDLSGWKIVDDETVFYELSGEIEAGGYFLIEDNEDAVASRTADLIVGLSLANSGDILRLEDAEGNLLDRVNGNAAEWYAGDSDLKLSMERLNPEISNDSAENWASAVSSNGALSADGLEILGSPGTANFNFKGYGPSVWIDDFGVSISNGDEIELSINIDDAEDLYAYGFELKYSPTLLEFVEAVDGGFLKTGNDVETAFNAALKDAEEGRMIVGDAQLGNEAEAANGSGVLFSLRFKVISDELDGGEVLFSGNSFAADVNGYVPVVYENLGFTLSFAAEGSAGEEEADDDTSGTGPVAAVENLKVVEDEERWKLALSWEDDAGGAEKYRVMRALADGSFLEVGETTELSFVDESPGLLPNIEYTYLIISVNGDVHSVSLEALGLDSRGLSGDNDKNDIVDGRDIERLARAYGKTINDEGFDAALDSSFDAVIDGSDLINIGSNFAMTY